MPKDFTPRLTLFGRKPAPEREALEAPEELIPIDQLKEVRWTPPIPVLDQEDLLAQDIHTSEFIQGETQDVDALGSCTAQASTASFAERLAAVKGVAALASVGISPTDTRANEIWAIKFYHAVTTAYGGPDGEWPPNDDGSSGIYCCDELEVRGLIESHKSATTVWGLLSLLQKGSAEVGGPWFNSMMTPDSNGFIDGDGSTAAIKRVIASGEAGGHERYVGAIIQLKLTSKGEIDLERTILEDRNSWDANWGPLGGSYRYHASFLQATLNQTDFKAFVVAA
jgi:hypothetical protein